MKAIASLLFLLIALPLVAQTRQGRSQATGHTRQTTERGPESVLLPSFRSALVAIRVAFRTGSVDDPKGKEGLTALTAMMLGEGGTKKHTYAEVVDLLYPLAAEIRVQVDKEMTVFSGTVHRDNLEKYAILFAEQLTEARFADEDFKRHRQDAIDYLSKTLRGNDDETLGKEALNAILYAGHPYGYPVSGTVEGLKAITLEDVKGFAHTHFTRDRMIVGIAGGYPAAFPKAFSAKFALLPDKSAPAIERPEPKKPSGLEVLFVEKPARANAISIGYPLLLTRKDDDFYPLYVANSYLGEHRTFNGVLMNRLRGTRGLNYGDYSYIEHFRQDGGSTFPLPNIPRSEQYFSIWIRPVVPQNTLFATRAAIYELDKLVRNGIPEKGFEQTKKFLAVYSKLWMQSPGRRLGYAIDAKLYGKDFQKELERRLPTMTREQVNAVVNKYLQAKNLACAIVTADAESYRKALLSGEATPVHYDSEGTPTEILEEDRVIEKFPLPVKEDRVRIVPVEEIFEK